MIVGVQSDVRALLEVSAPVDGCKFAMAGPEGPGVAGLVVARRNRSERGSNEHSSPQESARANSYIALLFYFHIFTHNNQFIISHGNLGTRNLSMK